MLKPVYYPAAHCAALKIVVTPCTNAIHCNQTKTIVRSNVMQLGSMFTQFESRRYPFGLMLWNAHLSDLLKEILQQKSITRDVEAQCDTSFGALAGSVSWAASLGELPCDDEPDLRGTQVLMLGVFEIVLELYQQSRAVVGGDNHSGLYAHFFKAFRPLLEVRLPGIAPCRQTVPPGDLEAQCWLDRVFMIVDVRVKHDTLEALDGV